MLGHDPLPCFFGFTILPQLDSLQSDELSIMLVGQFFLELL